jgi:cell division protein FtsW (lipid II flippase)
MAEKSIGNLSKLWKFWQQAKWWLIILLFIVIMMVFYNKEQLGTINVVILIVFIILFLLLVMFFNDNKGVMGNSVQFSLNPLPPHLGLDGVSNEVKYSY